MKIQLVLAFQKIIVTFILLSLFVTGCGQSIPNVPSPITMLETPTEFTSSTEVPSQTITASIQLNSTVEVTPTLGVATKVITAQPTYSKDEASSHLMGFLQNNGGCELPCIWGISLKDNSPQTIKDFISRFGKIDLKNDLYIASYEQEKMGGMIAVLWQNDLRTYISFSHYESEGIKESLKLYVEFTESKGSGANQTISQVFGDAYFTQLFKYYLMPQFLKNYGKPSHVYIYPFYTDPSAPNVSLFSLVMTYDEGILVEYLFPKEAAGNNFIGCPSKSAYFTIEEWNTALPLTLEEMVQGMTALGINKLNFSLFKPLQEVSSLTVEEFFKTFSENNNSCIDTAKNLWPFP